MAVAAALVLIPAASAQDPNHEAYLLNEDKGIGYNKYLVSNTPDADGNYMLRIENFITGKVKATATPTDFVLVLDISGSMQYDYRQAGQSVPTYITKAANDALDDNNTKKLRLDDGAERGFTHWIYNNQCYKGGAVGSTGSGGAIGITWFTESANGTGGAGNGTRWYYYPDDQKFYRIFKYHTAVDGTQRYYLYFDRRDDSGTVIERRYIIQDGEDITTTTEMPTNITANNQVIIIDNLNDSGYKLYRYATRKDALKHGVDAFLDMILEENQKDQWAEGVTKHQVSIVAFSGNQTPALTEPTYTSQNSNTKVAKIFREITGDNVQSYKDWDATTAWTGSTYIYKGVNAGRRLFEQLQEAPNMSALNGAGGPNRNKVMVVFTDGEPTAYSATDTPKAGYTGTRGMVALYCEEGVIIKDTGLGNNEDTGNPKINAKIYTINLSSNNTYVPPSLEHLSSNYSKGKVTGATTGNAAANMFEGTKDGDGFYMDATKMDNLADAFKAIAAANTGAMSTTLVAVDKVSDSFMLPFTTEDVDKVTMYTAQCIGTKEITVNGVTKEYLAFAEPIKVDERRGLRSLWVIRENSTTHEMEWRDAAEGGRIDIDDDVEFRVTEDGKSIIVSGFNYADLWCGQDLYHENERQTVATTDPNYDYQVDGYRGFKIIFEFPIHVDPDALGGVHVPTNDPSSGLYKAGDDGMPTSMEVQYPEPDLPVPIKLIVKKAGLKLGESANFTVQRKLIGDDSAEYEDVLTFVLTGGVAVPEIRIPNLDPAYYYKIKEEDWSWAYENISKDYYTTDPNDNPAPKNPIQFENKPKEDTPKHAEAKADNKMRKTTDGASTAEFLN